MYLLDWKLLVTNEFVLYLASNAVYLCLALRFSYLKKGLSENSDARVKYGALE